MQDVKDDAVLSNFEKNKLHWKSKLVYNYIYFSLTLFVFQIICFNILLNKYSFELQKNYKEHYHHLHP